MGPSGLRSFPLPSSNKENAKRFSGSSCRTGPRKPRAGLASTSQRPERLPLRELKLSSKDQNPNAAANDKRENDRRAPATKKRECSATKSEESGHAVCRQAQLPKPRIHRDGDDGDEPPRSCFSFLLPSRVSSKVSRHKKCSEASHPTIKQACSQLERGPKTLKRDQVCENASKAFEAIRGKAGNPMELSLGLPIRSSKLRIGADSDAAFACTPTSTPPPIPSNSPEILFRQSEHEALRLCFGGPLLGDGLGTVHYRRKCKPRGVLTVAEDPRSPGSVNSIVDSMVQSPSTPLPAEASVEWMVTEEKESESGTLIKWTDQSPSTPLPAEASVEWMVSQEQEVEVGTESNFDFLTTRRDQSYGIASQRSVSMIASENWKSSKATAPAAIPKKHSERKLNLAGSSYPNRVIWREGLLPRLGRLQELGSFSLSLEGLLTLDANRCCDTETLNENLFSRAPAPARVSGDSELHYPGAFWPVEGNRCHTEKSYQWAVSHTNSLFEASHGLSRGVQQISEKKRIEQLHHAP